jgi:putative toxin-antitoxin system antitoxin component (TIGR02293 family)
MAYPKMSYEFHESETLRNWIDNSKLAAASGQSQSISVKDLETAWAPRFAADEIDALVIPRRTMARRKAAAARLSPEEQDRAFTLAQIQLEADRVFANPEKASRWLRTQNNRLSGQTPLSLLSTAAGAAVVTEMLVQIDHGMYA